MVVVASSMAGIASPVNPGDAGVGLLCLALVGAFVLTFQHPIHVRYRTKMYMGSVTLYLMAALLPPPLAALAAGLGTFAGEMTVRSRKGGSLANVASQSSRWTIVALLGSLVAHAGGSGNVAALCGAAVVLWAGDMLTSPLTLAPLVGEPPLRIIVTLAREAGPSEAAQYLIGLLGAMVAVQRVWGLVLLVLPTVLVYVTSKHAKELHQETRRVLENMADTVDLRDPYTGGHSERVAELTAAILRELPLQGQEADLIVAAARVHDIGKIAIPDEILRKDGPLAPQERAVMETHPDRGADLLMRYPDFARGAAIIRHHHERWDGAGYPSKLRGREIPFGARVIAVADSFDAMTTDRPYRPALSPGRALEILQQGRGAAWDPAIVDALLRVVAGREQPEAVAVHQMVAALAPRDELRPGFSV